MLAELVVTNLGVIERTELLLDSGMVALTGETGAGKTLVVQAIGLLTGGRADAALVGGWGEEARVDGRFVDGDTEVVLSRVVARSGRSRAYVDGSPATAARLSELGAGLIDLHGQHAHQSLLKGSVQRHAIDQFGQIETTTLASLVDELRACDAALAELGGDERARAREIDLLRFQINEIKAAAISSPDEDDVLDRQETVLAHAADHQRIASEVVAALDNDAVAVDALGSALASLDGREPFADLATRLRSVLAELSDIASEARTRADSIDEDPAALDELRQRRAMLRELRRKYGDDLETVLGFGADATNRLSDLESVEERAAELDQRRARLVDELAAEQAQVLAQRKQAAPELASAVEAHLAGLAMGGARFAATIDGDAGEQVVLCLAANVGHEPLPLTKVASGGELARTMLALRLVLSAGPPTLVFDEVDAGIGGDVANRVGESLAKLAADHQVFVVTHLAQVAAFADHHVAITKRHTAAETVSDVTTLDDQSRVAELSRMLSGSPDSSSARLHAAELLSSAASVRAN